MNSIWTFYRVRLDFLTKLCASVPADSEMVKRWQEARKPKVRPPIGKSINEIQEEVFSTLVDIGQGDDEEQNASLLIFQRDNGALVMRAATIKAHIKDCARVLSNQYIGTIDRERAFSTRVINGIYHDEKEYWLPILRPDGERVISADGTYDKAVHPRPGISALKTFEYVQPARIDFTLKVLTARPGAKKGKTAEGGETKSLPTVRREDIEILFQYGGVHGYAGERSDGEGRYTYSISEVEK